MQRRVFLKKSSLLTAGVLASEWALGRSNDEFPMVRVPLKERNFSSKIIEETIQAFQSKVKDRELAWLFGNCFPNTLDTTVFYSEREGIPDTYVITGDIDAMWLRDSSAQVWPYLQFAKADQSLDKLIQGLIRHQVKCILKDPYANAFYGDPTRRGEWQTDRTEMLPGVHERKWEIDSLCYPIRLAYHYWKESGEEAPFDDDWKKSVQLTLKVFKEQQRKEGMGPYRFQRETEKPTDSLPMAGYGFPVNPVGLICSAFRPSDDATVFPFLIPSNFFAVTSLRQAAEIIQQVYDDQALAASLTELAREVDEAIRQYAIVEHAQFGQIYAFEVDGFGSHYLMDDANVPSLLALPYLGAVPLNDPIYQNTRKFLLSSANPYFYKGKAGEGIGGPHVGQDMIWPMSIVMRAMTSTDEQEISHCIGMLKRSHAGKGFMHESFHKDDPSVFTRSWFAWTNTLFGELLWKVMNENGHLLT